MGSKTSSGACIFGADKEGDRGSEKEGRDATAKLLGDVMRSSVIKKGFNSIDAIAFSIALSNCLPFIPRTSPGYADQSLPV